MKKMCFLPLALISIFLFSCMTMPAIENAGNRELFLDGIAIKEWAWTGSEECWYAVDNYNNDDLIDKVRFQVGYLKGKTGELWGFILWDDGTVGELANFSREGIDLRWDWGSCERDGQSRYRYCFVIQPDGTGLYYDFVTSKDGFANPRRQYKTKKFLGDGIKSKTILDDSMES